MLKFDYIVSIMFFIKNDFTLTFKWLKLYYVACTILINFFTGLYFECIQYHFLIHNFFSRHETLKFYTIERCIILSDFNKIVFHLKYILID